MLAGYPALEEVLWVQEEPQNMGAWEFVRPYLEKAIDGRAPLGLVSRPPSASPAEGSDNLHAYDQRQLVEQRVCCAGDRDLHAWAEPWLKMSHSNIGKLDDSER